MQQLIHAVHSALCGDLFHIPLPGGSSVGLSLLVLILVPSGIFFTLRTRVLPIRFLPEMLRLTVEKRSGTARGSLSGLQALIVSTATRVGMGNMAGVVAAVCLGGAGAVFWMWVTALLGCSTAFVEAVLAQLHKQPDPLYGGFRGGPAYYIHAFFDPRGRRRRHIVSVLFALSALLCWCGISQVVGNSVSSAMQDAFSLPPIVSTAVLVALSAVIVLRRQTTVKVLDVLVPIMATCYFLVSVVVIVMNLELLPGVFRRILGEAFGLRQAVAGGFGATLMQGVQRGLFSNEAGSGSAPCAAAAADVSHPAKSGLLQAFGVLIDTLVICTCTAMIMLLAPEQTIAGLEGMPLLQAAMHHHFGYAGVVFTAVALWLFAFSTFLGVLFYARSNVAYLFGESWTAQTLYKLLCLVMLFMGGLAAYTFVWQLADIGIALMTVLNLAVIIPMSGRAIAQLQDYRQPGRQEKKAR